MKRTITVRGVGHSTTTPDVADVRLGVAVTRTTVAEARVAAADKAARIVEAVTAAGVGAADVRTASLVVQPEYDYKDGVQSLRGQSVSHQFAIVVRDLDQIGQVVDGGLAAGATTLDGVTLRTADPAPAAEAARLDAFRDARARAASLAAEAGVRLGKVLAIAEADPDGLPRPMAMGKVALAADASPTPIQVGETDVVVALSVVFAIT